MERVVVVDALESCQQHLAGVDGRVEAAVAIDVGVDDQVGRLRDHHLVVDDGDAQRGDEAGLLHEGLRVCRPCRRRWYPRARRCGRPRVAARGASDSGRPRPPRCGRRGRCRCWWGCAPCRRPAQSVTSKPSGTCEERERHVRRRGGFCCRLRGRRRSCSAARQAGGGRRLLRRGRVLRRGPRPAGRTSVRITGEALRSRHRRDTTRTRPLSGGGTNCPTSSRVRTRPESSSSPRRPATARPTCADLCSTSVPDAVAREPAGRRRRHRAAGSSAAASRATPRCVA